MTNAKGGMRRVSDEVVALQQCTAHADRTGGHYCQRRTLLNCNFSLCRHEPAVRASRVQQNIDAIVPTEEGRLIDSCAHLMRSGAALLFKEEQLWRSVFFHSELYITIVIR